MIFSGVRLGFDQGPQDGFGDGIKVDVNSAMSSYL